MLYLYRNGASKSGLFCASSLVFERMRIDHEVDVYQTVKQMRVNRPHFVENMVCNIIETFPVSVLVKHWRLRVLL